MLRSNLCLNVSVRLFWWFLASACGGVRKRQQQKTDGEFPRRPPLELTLFGRSPVATTSCHGPASSLVVGYQLSTVLARSEMCALTPGRQRESGRRIA